MSRSGRLILSALLVMFLFMACVTSMPSTAIPTSTPNSVVAATFTVAPAATTIPTGIPSATAYIPIFDSFKPIARLHLADSERILNMMPESDGTAWLLTDQRAMQYSQGTWNEYLPPFSGKIIGIDSKQHLWVVSDDGDQVSVWDGSAWTNMGPETGWETPTPDNDVELTWSIATDALDHIWLGANRDVRMFDGLKWKVFDLKDLGIPRPEIEDAYSRTTVAFLKVSGYIWVNHCYWIDLGPVGGGGARWYDGHNWHGSDSPVAPGCAAVVNEDNDGNIWLGLDKNLWRLNTSMNSWKRFPAPEPPEDGWFGFFSDLAVDAVGNPWPELTRCGGASCFTGSVRYQVTGGQWLQIGDVAFDNSFLYFDAAGQGWVFKYDTFFHLIDHQLILVAELPILEVAAAPSGKLWFIGKYKGETWLWAQS